MNYKLNLATIHPEIATELSPDSPVPAEEISASSNKKLPWVCPRGHHWETSPYNRQRGQLCPYCSDRKVLIGFNDLATTHPDIANQLTDTDLALTITKKSSKKVEWSCDLGHVWTTSVSHRVKGTGCPYCSGRKVLAGFNDLATTHPELAEELVNPEIATTLSAYSGKPVEWVCELGHVWETKVATRQRTGCPYCSNRKLLPGFNDLATTHPELAKELVDPEIATTVFAGSHDKVDWVCSRGHVWNASIVHRRNRSGCPYCTNRKILVGFNDLATTHPELAKEMVTPELASTLSFGSGTRTEWKCDRGHTWSAVFSDRVHYRTGCPECCIRNVSHAEEELAEFVKGLLPGINVIDNTRTVIPPLELDIYVPDKKIAIEFNGIYWHSEDKGKDRDYHYTKWSECKQQGIQLITIWEDDWRDRKETVKSMLAHKLGVSRSDRVYARKTTVEEITYQESSEFLDRHHIQGSTTGSVYLGLKHQGDIVAVSVWRKNRDVLYLDRYATSVNVIGGMGKLLKAGVQWARAQELTEIITFADHEVSDGGLYDRLGFVLDKEIDPDYSYVVNGKREHKFNYRLKRFRDDPGLEYQEGLTEKELAELNGIPRVWDSGKSRYVIVVD